MEYVDSVYGMIQIDDPAVRALIASPSLQRLKQIDQAGFLTPFRPEEDTITRFEHSVGVFLLLKRFGAPREEQVAGLIHDVSHTAFSHCVIIYLHMKLKRIKHSKMMFSKNLCESLKSLLSCISMAWTSLICLMIVIFL